MSQELWFYLPIGLCLISLAISMVSSGPIGWLKRQSTVIAWLGYIWAPMIVLLAIIKLTGHS